MSCLVRSATRVDIMILYKQYDQISSETEQMNDKPSNYWCIIWREDE